MLEQHKPLTEEEKTAYHATHRMPRVLLVANDARACGEETAYPLLEVVPGTLDCNCSQFTARGAEYVHALVPGRYEKSALESVKDVYRQAEQAGRPYDIILVDSEACRGEINRWAKTLEPKPGVVLYVRYETAEGASEAEAKRLRERGIPAFCLREMLWPADAGEGPPPRYDEQVARALGEEGIARLACAPEDSVKLQWSRILREHGPAYQEVRPLGAARVPEKAAGGGLPGL